MASQTSKKLTKSNTNIILDILQTTQPCVPLNFSVICSRFQDIHGSKKSSRNIRSILKQLLGQNMVIYNSISDTYGMFDIPLTSPNMTVTTAPHVPPLFDLKKGNYCKTIQKTKKNSLKKKPKKKNVKKTPQKPKKPKKSTKAKKLNVYNFYTKTRISELSITHPNISVSENMTQIAHEWRKIKSIQTKYKKWVTGCKTYNQQSVPCDINLDMDVHEISAAAPIPINTLGKLPRLRNKHAVTTSVAFATNTPISTNAPQYTNSESIHNNITLTTTTMPADHINEYKNTMSVVSNNTAENKSRCNKSVTISDPTQTVITQTINEEKQTFNNNEFSNDTTSISNHSFKTTTTEHNDNGIILKENDKCDTNSNTINHISNVINMSEVENNNNNHENNNHDNNDVVLQTKDDNNGSGGNSGDNSGSNSGSVLNTTANTKAIQVIDDKSTSTVNNNDNSKNDNIIPAPAIHNNTDIDTDIDINIDIDDTIISETTTDNDDNNNDDNNNDDNNNNDNNNDDNNNDDNIIPEIKTNNDDNNNNHNNDKNDGNISVEVATNNDNSSDYNNNNDNNNDDDIPEITDNEDNEKNNTGNNDNVNDNTIPDKTTDNKKQAKTHAAPLLSSTINITNKPTNVVKKKPQNTYIASNTIRNSTSQVPRWMLINVFGQNFSKDNVSALYITPKWQNMCSDTYITVTLSQEQKIITVTP